MSHVDDSDARGGNRNVLVAVAVVLLVTALAAAVWLANRNGSSGVAPTPSMSSQETVTAEATSSESASSASSSTDPTSTPSTRQEQLESEMPTQVAGLEPEITADPDPVEQGAEAAVSGVFKGGSKTLAFSSSDWPSAEAALEYVQAQAAAEFTSDELLKTGDVGQPARGQYWYYEAAGSEGVLYWVEGDRAFRAAGPPNAVQEFFLRFPAS